MTSTSGSSSDTKGLTYDIGMNFFTGMMINWNLYGRQSLSKMSTNENIDGYDLSTSSYGGSLELNLSRKGGGRRGNNNNNNNNSNNNNSNNNNSNNNNSNNNNYNYNNKNNSSSRINFRLPDIGLSFGHVESDSQSALYPVKEARDNAGLSVNYRIHNLVNLNMTHAAETYKNLITGGNYDTASTSFGTVIPVLPAADLSVSGSRTDRTTTGLAGFGLHDTIWNSALSLNFKEQGGIRHYYNYSYSKAHSDASNLTSHNAAASVSYQLSRELSLHGGLNYTLAEYITKATVTNPEELQTMESGGAQTGVAYRKLYTPEFLGPFVMNTDYNFNTGYAKLESTRTNGSTGSGLYYENSAALGFMSNGWQKDSLSTSYNISSRRDRSPLTNNVRSQGFRLDASTVRLPRTTLKANVSYTVTESSASQYSVFLNNAQNTSSIGHRTLLYGVNALYIATPFLSFDAGASQSHSSNSTPTLSTLQSSADTPVEQLVYTGAHYGKALTRNVMFRANARDEWRYSSWIKTETRNFDAGFDYRIRQILMNFTYRWDEYLSEKGLNTYRQSYMVKLSRPF